jgi:hypothetical protein
MCATLANGGTLTEPGFQRSEIAIPEDTDPEDFIGGILREKCHPSDDVYGFLPYCELTATLTPETIKIILERKLGLKGEKLDTMLVLSGRLIRIFAILIFAGMTEYIEKFIDTGITDDDLPLPHGPGRSLDSRISFLTRAQVDSFCFFQWLVNVPVLNLTADESQPVVYAKETRMPFLSVEPRPRGRGGQGRVSKIIMHPDHVRGQASVGWRLVLTCPICAT